MLFHGLIRNGFLEKCMADEGFGIYVFSWGKEIHYLVLCAVFLGFMTIRARDFQDYWKMKSYLRRMLVVMSINCVANFCLVW